MQDKELKKILGTISNGLVIGWDAKNNTFVAYKNVKFTPVPSHSWQRQNDLCRAVCLSKANQNVETGIEVPV